MLLWGEPHGYPPGEWPRRFVPTAFLDYLERLRSTGIGKRAAFLVLSRFFGKAGGDHVGRLKSARTLYMNRPEHSSHPDCVFMAAGGPCDNAKSPGRSIPEFAGRRNTHEVPDTVRRSPLPRPLCRHARAGADLPAGQGRRGSGAPGRHAELVHVDAVSAGAASGRQVSAGDRRQDPAAAPAARRCCGAFSRRPRPAGRAPT